MTSATTLRTIVHALDRASIPHMLAGSFASSFHGLARTTADNDLVIDPPPSAIEGFVAGLDAHRYHVPLESAQRAVQARDHFNLIDNRTGWKIDLIVRRDRPFSVAEFDRRAPVTVMGVAVFVASAEDTVLSKLEWSKLSDSERQLQDAVEVLRIRRPDLDAGYLDRWAADLGVVDLLVAARAAAGS